MPRGARSSQRTFPRHHHQLGSWCGRRGRTKVWILTSPPGDPETHSSLKIISSHTICSHLPLDRILVSSGVTGAWTPLHLGWPRDTVLSSEMQTQATEWGFWETSAGQWLWSITLLPLPPWTMDKCQRACSYLGRQGHTLRAGEQKDGGARVTKNMRVAAPALTCILLSSLDLW